MKSRETLEARIAEEMIAPAVGVTFRQARVRPDRTPSIWTAPLELRLVLGVLLACRYWGSS